jgi:hypothetical protein
MERIADGRDTRTIEALPIFIRSSVPANTNAAEKVAHKVVLKKLYQKIYQLEATHLDDLSRQERQYPCFHLNAVRVTLERCCATLHFHHA